MDTGHNFKRFDAIGWASRHVEAQREWDDNELERLKTHPPCFVCGYTTLTYWTVEGVRICEDCAYSQKELVVKRIQELGCMHLKRAEQLKDKKPL